jgi:Flp pilus assembly pilin Flp
MDMFKRFLVEEEGAEVTEWALLVVVLGLAILVGGPTLKEALSNALTTIGDKVNAGAGELNEQPFDVAG